jgi:hypothetical protein
MVRSQSETTTTRVGGSIWRVGLIAIASVAIAAVTAGQPAMAKGPRPDPSSGGSCQVQPNPVANGSQYTVSGSGVASTINLTIFVGGGSILMTTSSSSGSYAASAWLAGATPGSYPVVVYAQSDSRHRNALASCTLRVQ